MIHRDEPSRPFSRLLACCLAACAGLLLMLLSVAPAAAQVTGVSYTVSPIGARVYWDNDAALDDGFLYGGELGLGFGQYLEVSGIYLYGNRFETDFSGFSGENQAVLDALAGLAPRDVTVQRYGAKLRVNLGAGSIIPFLSVGTGIIQLDPDDIDASENIYVNGGVGATFSLADRYTISVAAENLAYRYNPGQIFFTDADLRQIGLTRDNFNQQTVYNPAISASLKFYLGGRSEDEMTVVDRALLRQFRGGGFRLAVEPFYGQINFDDKLGFPDTQALAGVNAGFDLGPYVGVRGFYWRATDEAKAFDEGLNARFTELQFYGGELDLRFGNQLGSLAPYLIFGGGYLNVGDEYEDFSGVRPESRYFAIGGGGVEFPLSEAIKLQAGVRGLFMSDQDVEDLSDPSSVRVSPMFSGGINFNLGGSGRTAGAVLEREMAASRAEAERREATVQEELAVLRARLDSLEAARATAPAMPQQPQPAPQPRMVTYIDSTGAEVAIPLEEPAPLVTRDTVFIREERPSNLSGQTLTIPVPEEGEIYIRFGSAAGAAVEPPLYAPPTVVMAGMAPQPQMLPRMMAPGDSVLAGGLTAAQIRQIVRQAVAEQPRAGLTAEEFNTSLRQMEDRLERRIARESNRLRAEMQEQPREVRVLTPEGQPVAPADTAARAPSSLMQTFAQRQLVSVLPFIGVRLGESTNQFLIGARADYRFPGKKYWFVPEAALGFSSDGVALSALGNVVYPLGNVLSQVRPYVGAGAGFVTDSGLSGLDLTLNLLAGAEYSLVNGMTFFGEFSTLDFFDFNRVLLGYRLRF